MKAFEINFTQEQMNAILEALIKDEWFSRKGDKILDEEENK